MNKEYIRQIIILISVLFFAQSAFAGNCIARNDSLILSSQNEVDMFPVNYPGCTSITGKLIISGNNITNLQSLHVLTYVGFLKIRDNPRITSLNGLNNLRFSGYVEISHNESLLSLNGLEALDSISNSLEIKYNASLVTLDGLNSLRVANNLLSIFSNPSLLSLDGLEAVQRISQLSIYGNQSLTSLLGLDSMIKLRTVDIWINESLSCCEIINKIRENNPAINLTNIFTNSVGCNSVNEIAMSSGNNNCCKTEFSVSSKQICTGQSIVVGTHTYTSTGLYIDSFRTAVDCDSIVYTELRIGQPSYTIVERELCSGQPFILINGTQITTSGSYIDTIPFTCDSVVEYRLNFIDNITTERESIACEGMSITLPTGNHVFESGTYIDTVRNIGFCDSIYITRITFFPNTFSVSLDAEVIVNIGDSIKLTPTYTNGIPATWTWQSSADLSCLNCENPAAKPYQNAIYELKVQAENGCEDTAKIYVFVKESNIYIPTAFSPNNDNVNDELNVFLASPKSFSLKLFNRYGELVFYSNDVNNKWNGTYKNENCPSDVYAYIIDVILFNEKIISQKGTVTLLR